MKVLISGYVLTVCDGNLNCYIICEDMRKTQACERPMRAEGKHEPCGGLTRLLAQ